ncbi:MAG: hypothetical protein M1269_01605 [Chloroflexi bacterium]|nr:hypothetical protein [Chloroflexota bacterium]
MTGLDLEIEKLSTEVRDNPEEAETWYSLGRATMLRGLNFAALMAFEKTQELKPEHSLSRLGTATVMANVGLDREALGVLAAFTPYSPYDLRGYLLFNHLKARVRVTEEVAKSFSCYEKVTPWKVRLSTTLEEIKQEKETLRQFIRELSRLPVKDDVLCRDALARKKAEERLARLDEDEKELKALEKFSTDEQEPKVIPPGEVGPAEEIKEETRKKLEELLAPSLSVRGVVYSGIFRVDGRLLVKVSSEDIAQKIVSGIVSQGILAIQDLNAGTTLHFWNLDFENGIIVFEGLNKDYMRLVIGKKGATFGTIRFHLDRNRDALLKAVPGGER